MEASYIMVVSTTNDCRILVIAIFFGVCICVVIINGIMESFGTIKHNNSTNISSY